jgi:lamin tail-like protein/nuclease A inhibitor-like protein
MTMRKILVALMVSLGALEGTALAAPGGVVINEVMYHPYNESTFGRYEFVELYNGGTTSVDLGDAVLTDSQDFVNICNNVSPTDHEGVFHFPSGTSIAPGGFLTLWHTAIPGVTDRPGNLVYDHFVFFGNMVLANGGDQVTLMRCGTSGPSAIDSLDYGALGLGVAASNVSIERIDPAAATQSSSNWGLSTAPAAAQAPNNGYSRGGTPGGVNSLANLACVSAFNAAVGPHLDDLLFLSESDREFDLVAFPGAGGAAPTAASVLALVGAPAGSTALARPAANYYSAFEPSSGSADPNAATLVEAAFAAQLTDVVYVAVFAPAGSVNDAIVDVYLVGRTSCGDLVGIHAIAIET